MRSIFSSIVFYLLLCSVAFSQAAGGEGQGGNGSNDEISVQIFPHKATVVVADSVKFEAAVKDADGEDIEDATVVWSVVDETIGSVGETGMFTGILEGETFVVAAYESYADTAEVEVVTEEPALPEGVNTISIQREFPDGKITKFGSTNAEGDTVTIGGMPFPFNFMNGMKLYFPDGSLSDDITITVKIPEFGHVNNESNEIEYDYDYIVNGVTFVVSIGDAVQEPFNFDTPIEVMLPFKRGLLTKLGIDVEDLGMYYVGQLGELIREGIGQTEIDEENDVVVGDVAHFSDIVLAPTGVVPTDVLESQPEAIQVLQNYPNPFNPETTIEYVIPQTSQVSVVIYNVVGQQVRTLVSEFMPAGSYSVVWDGRDDNNRPVNSGVYICHFKAGQTTKSQKLMLMK